MLAPAKHDPTAPVWRPIRPDWFPAALRRFDPTLRVRWSRERRTFLIEARATSRKGIMKPVRMFKTPSGHILERMMPEHSDRYVQWHDQVYAILETPRLVEDVLAFILASDVTRHGKARQGRLAAAVEAAEARVEAERDAKSREKLDDLLEDRWKHGEYLSGNRLSMVEGAGPNKVHT